MAYYCQNIIYYIYYLRGGRSGFRSTGYPPGILFARVWGVGLDRLSPLRFAPLRPASPPFSSKNVTVPDRYLDFWASKIEGRLR